MANPTPIYTVRYGSEQLPGYVQGEDRPVVLNSVDNKLLGKDGFDTAFAGTAPRDIALNFLIMSSLGSSVGDLAHLEDCKTQWRNALKILTRNPGLKQLEISDTDRYYLAKVDRVSAPLTSERSRSIRYTVDFTAQPWAIGKTAVTTTFTGNGTPSIAIGDSRKTYPIFSIPSGVTAFTVTDENGKILQFLRGTASGTITVDSGTLTASTASGGSAVTTMVNLGFGLFYAGTDGVYNMTVSGFAGSGTVTVSMYPRYEL